MKVERQMDISHKPVCRSLGASSDIVKVNLPRPMGLVFEENKARGQVVVADFVQGSQAEKLSKVIVPYPTLPTRRMKIAQLACSFLHVHCCCFCQVTQYSITNGTAAS